MEYVDTEADLHWRLSSGSRAFALLDHVPGDRDIAAVAKKLLAGSAGVSCVIVGERLGFEPLVALIDLLGVGVIDEPLESAAFPAQLAAVERRLLRSMS